MRPAPQGTHAPVIALTMGEPAGIGTETTLRAWQRRGQGHPVFCLIDDAARVRRQALALGIDAAVEDVPSLAAARQVWERALPVLGHAVPVQAVPGKPDARNGAAVVDAIERAARLALAGEAVAVVTKPIHTATRYEAGFQYPGHTEFLGALAGVPAPVMMLACPGLRVVPVTVHMPLSRVSKSLDRAAIVNCGRVTDAALRRDFGIAAPRLAVAALNPHGGEDGAMGHEEQQIIAPAIGELRAAGIAVSGPAAADTLFHDKARAAYDAVLCMYHDQALIPLKTLDFRRGINITLGLPFVRTSPDHGTALDIAGRGVADADSLIAALEAAADMARRRCSAEATSAVA